MSVKELVEALPEHAARKASLILLSLVGVMWLVISAFAGPWKDDVDDAVAKVPVIEQRQHEFSQRQEETQKELAQLNVRVLELLKVLYTELGNRRKVEEIDTALKQKREDAK